MSEFTKHSLTSIGTNKKEKQGKKVKTTIRFELPLLESNEQAYSQLNYKDLLISREKRDRQKSKEGLQNGFDAISAEDAELVRRLEEKYGNAEAGGKKKKTKRGRFENFADLGAGYDETDPFIDNTDAYDEVVPEQMTTAHGGFYINCGPLEFKQLSDQSDVDEPVNKVKRRAKRVMTIVEEEEEEEENEDNTSVLSAKKSKGGSGEGSSDVSKKRKLSQDLQLLKKKKKHAIDELTKKKTATVKELLKEKRDTLEITSTTDGKKTTAGESVTLTSITDAIESVVNGAMEDEASQESTASQASKSSAASQSSDSDASQEQDGNEKNLVKEETSLPENLPEDLKELIYGLQRAGKTTAEGKCKFFTIEVNKMLLGVEKICNTLSSNSRNLVYKHLESYLPCTKDTLMKRAKKLNIKSEEDQLKKLLAKLKADIDAVMPAVLENYGKESQRVVQENPHLYWELYRYYWSTEELPSDGEDKAGSGKSRIPRKIFPWTKELQSQVLGIIDIKTRCLDLAKSRKESVDQSLQDFLEKDVKSLWPPGWMNVPKLLSLKNKKVITRKPQKQVSFAIKVSTAAPVPAQPTFNSSITTAASTTAPVSSSVTSLSWSQSSVTVTPISSCHSLPSHSNGVLSQASSSAVGYSQAGSMSLTVSKTNYSSVKTSPTVDKPSNINSKVNNSVDKFSPKPSDIPSSVCRTTTVIVPNSPSKNTNPELSTVVSSSSTLETQPQMSLANIPDCISVTPAVVPSQTTSVHTSPPKPMSLKHRILHDAAIDLTNCMKPNPVLADSVGVTEVDLTVNKSKDITVVETTPESQKSDITAKLKLQRKKKKEAKEFATESQLIEQQKVEPSPQPQISEKENERRLLEETNAAASFISQIINESLQSYPNASTIRNATVNQNPSPTPSPPRDLYHESKLGSMYQSDINQPKTAATQKKKSVERRSSAADSDMSVQMEVNRVLEELKELQGLSVGKTESAELDYSSKSSHNSLPVPSSHMNTLNTPLPKGNLDSHLKCNTIVNKRPTVGIGFQDEFQKHISQIKQEKLSSVSNSSSYPQVNQSAVSLHSTMRHATGPESSQSRNGGGSDMTTNYMKQSISSDPFAGLLFGGVQARSVLNSHYQDKTYDQTGLGVLPGISTFNPHTDDPFSMSPYAMKTDASKNQHSSPC